MASPRDIRKLAFQALFQFDARASTADADDVRRSLEGAGSFSPKDIERAMTLAVGAFEDRSSADAAMLELAPAWPAHRQAATDRAILRLAHFEMTRTTTPPRIVVSEAVELAKEFSTDKSPAFVNGLLDKILKRVLASRESAPSIPDAPEAPEAPEAPGAPRT